MSTAMSAHLHANEKRRIQELKRYEILDTPPDGTFDRVTTLVSRMFNMPIVIISLVDEDRIWFKSHYGLEVTELARDPGLCASAILSDDLYIIEDARTDARALSNPLVAGEFGLQFYAATPLKTKDGFNLGTLCLLDKKTRYLNEDQQSMLRELGSIVMDQLEVRLAARLAVRSQNQQIVDLEQENAVLRSKMAAAA